VTPYTPTEAKTAALAEFNDPGPAHINCCQAVVRFAVLVLGCDPDLVTVGRYFGGGIAGMGEACGAITGTAMALGMRDLCLGESADELRPRTAESLRETIRDFGDTFTCRRCADLTGFDLSTPEGHDAFMASEKRGRCAEYVGYMCDRLAPLLTDPESAGAA
jgi:C_GCAxxG_C_C family probable redox protein